MDIDPFLESTLIDNPESSFEIANRSTEPVHPVEHSTFDITNRSSIQLHEEVQEKYIRCFVVLFFFKTNIHIVNRFIYTNFLTLSWSLASYLEN